MKRPRPSTGRPSPIDAAEVRHLILTASLPADLQAELCERIVRWERPQTRWPFVMISAARNAEVLAFCLTLPRPKLAVRLWALLLQALNPDTGEVLYSRDELAERLGVQGTHVSSIMNAFERFGAVRKELIKIAGLKGRGAARYYVNPDIAWIGHLAERERQATEKPTALHLELIQGGKE